VDRGKPRVDLAPAQAQAQSAENRVVASRQVRHEAQRQRQQLAARLGAFDAAAVGPQDAGEHAQQGALARAIASDHAETLAAAQFEADILQRPVLVATQPPAHVERDADSVQPQYEIAHAASLG